MYRIARIKSSVLRDHFHNIIALQVFCVQNICIRLKKIKLICQWGKRFSFSWVNGCLLINAKWKSIFQPYQIKILMRRKSCFFQFCDLLWSRISAFHFKLIDGKVPKVTYDDLKNNPMILHSIFSSSKIQNIIFGMI